VLEKLDEAMLAPRVKEILPHVEDEDEDMRVAALALLHKADPAGVFAALSPAAAARSPLAARYSPAQRASPAARLMGARRAMLLGMSPNLPAKASSYEHTPIGASTALPGRMEHSAPPQALRNVDVEKGPGVRIPSEASPPLVLHIPTTKPPAAPVPRLAL